MVVISDIIGLVQALELPLTMLGGWLLFKKIKKDKQVLEWIGLIRELLEEYKRNNRGR